MTLYFLTPIMAIAFFGMFKDVKIKFGKKDLTSKILMVLMFAVPFIVFAFRDSSIGIDTKTYCYDFQYIAKFTFRELIIKGFGEYERGFLVFCKLLSFISTNPVVLLVGSSLLINFLFARVIYKQDTLLLVSVLVYFFLGNYLYNLNIMRQAIAVGIILNGIFLLLEKKYLKYSVVVLVAALFHTFSIVAFIFIPAVIFIKTKKQLVLTCIILGVVILTSLEIVHVIVLRYFSHFDYYFRNNFHSDQHFGLTSFAYVAIETFVLILMLKNKDLSDTAIIKGESFNEVNREKIIIYSIGLVFAAFGLIMMPRFGIYERIAKFFQPFLILAVPFALNGIKVPINKKVITLGLMVFSFVYYTYIIITNAYLIVPFKFWQGNW